MDGVGFRERGPGAGGEGLPEIIDDCGDCVVEQGGIAEGEQGRKIGEGNNTDLMRVRIEGEVVVSVGIFKKKERKKRSRRDSNKMT